MDRVHIAYAGCLGGCDRDTIFHAVRGQGSWTREVVAARAVANWGNDLSLDLRLERGGRPHLVFNDEPVGGSLWHATTEGADWITRVVDRGTLWVLAGSLGLGRDGRVGIAYYRLDEGRADTGTSARVGLSGVRADNLLDFLSGVSLVLGGPRGGFCYGGLHPLAEGSAFRTLGQSIRWTTQRKQVGSAPDGG